MISKNITALADKVQPALSLRFAEIDSVAEKNTMRVMQAFQRHRVSDACFAGTTGYGYDDMGREVLDKVYADVFGAEAALVRIGFVNGTHALVSAIFACLKPGDTLLSVTGLPYDTLRTSIGISGDEHGSLKFYGIEYAQVDLNEDSSADFPGIAAALADKSVSTVLIQRSRGYSKRRALTISEIEEIIEFVKKQRPDVS